ncbi:unnamed protein product [Mytilus coruscus]|uniref:Novel STAND NTPase 3 domain-containing protein n=1 Tax=Mytilus coruscus TaxID=42192 RepID=A0A6J8DTT6_MYTCO|nr:unnamed protein product [Mytilus coruscus]
MFTILIQTKLGSLREELDAPFLIAGPPGDLNDDKKRWLVVGICLHSILSPALRKYVDPIVNNLFNSLKISDHIDVQTHTGHLRTNGVRNFYLNYEPINMNKTTHGYRKHLYDYKVQNAIDLSKLFLQTNMTHYTAFDESCDSSALLGMVVNIDKFPGNVQKAATDVRSAIRNTWAHCNFTEWDVMKYNLSLQQIEDLIYLLSLNASEESQFVGELNKWRTNGTSFFQGTTIGLELINDLKQQIHVLVEYADVICKSADTEFSRVHTELTKIGNTLTQNNERISTLENEIISAFNVFDLHVPSNLNAFTDADIPEIERWRENSKDFIKTDIFKDILGILENQLCVLLIGVSGMGKTLTAQNIALHLCHEQGFTVVPCNNVKDIKKRYKENVRQVFFVDDICGKYTANISHIENWMRIKEFVKYIIDKGKAKVLATCRTEIFKQENVKIALKSFQKPFDLTVNYTTEDKIKIARKYIKEDDKLLTDIVIKDEFSPFMCSLYSQHDGFEVNEFLNSPYQTFSGEWDTLKTFDNEKFCVLFLCVIYHGKINGDIFAVPNDFDKGEKRKLKFIFECCKLARGTSRSVIKDKIEACVDTYFIKVDREYKVIHDKMFDFLCCYFSKSLIAPILKYADEQLICEPVQLESIQKSHCDFTITISSSDEHKYMDRLRLDLENGKIHWCLNNVQMRYKEYRDKFVNVVKDLDDIKRRSACRDGHLHTVDILLDKGSDINKTNVNGETPLYTACCGGHYDLVKRLIEKRADINKGNRYNNTPLLASCLAGDEDIARFLIDEGADVFEWDDVFNVACLGDLDKIVKN